MILVDTCVWVAHLRQGVLGLVDLLERSAVAMHPFVVGEIACGSLRNRQSMLELLQDLPAAVVADSDEVLQFIQRHALHEGPQIGRRQAGSMCQQVGHGNITIQNRISKLHFRQKLRYRITER